MKFLVRRKMFMRLKEVEARAGIKLVSAEDEKFIRMCWKKRLNPGKNQDKWRDDEIPQEYLS